MCAIFARRNLQKLREVAYVVFDDELILFRIALDVEEASYRYRVIQVEHLK